MQKPYSRDIFDESDFPISQIRREKHGPGAKVSVLPNVTMQYYAQ